MSRSASLILIITTLVIVLRVPVSSDPLMPENAARPEGRQAAGEQVRYRSIENDLNEAFDKVVATLQTAVRTVTTVVKAVANAIYTVLVSIVKLVLHVAVNLAVKVAAYLLSLFLPL